LKSKREGIISENEKKYSNIGPGAYDINKE
jgi:hypothetical protein